MATIWKSKKPHFFRSMKNGLLPTFHLSNKKLLCELWNTFRTAEKSWPYKKIQIEMFFFV